MLQRGQRQALGHDAKGPRCSCRSFESLLHILVKCDGLASFESSGPVPLADRNDGAHEPTGTGSTVTETVSIPLARTLAAVDVPAGSLMITVSGQPASTAA